MGKHTRHKNDDLLAELSPRAGGPYDGCLQGRRVDAAIHLVSIVLYLLHKSIITVNVALISASGDKPSFLGFS